MTIYKFISHNRKILEVASSHGWLPGACYTNLRDLKGFKLVGFIDIKWENYSFKKHLEAVKSIRPLFTMACDVTDCKHLQKTIDEALELKQFCSNVIIIPKDPKLECYENLGVPEEFVLGYSVPSKYGKTSLQISSFKTKVHLLGGRPDIQRQLGDIMNIHSIDCNRFTIDAKYGYYFDGKQFKKHLNGGYENCIIESLKNINKIWLEYNLT